MREINLNVAQKRAVEHIFGPLLVIAGPGTGKTQLLSSRVAQILKQTDASPRNILCLTFTESGAQNMRDRLRSLIGDAAYEVTISTYHSFGSEIIKNYAEYFQTIGLDRTDDIRMERPVDDLTQIQIVEDIIKKLPFDSSLLSARYYIKSVVGTISDLKKEVISPDDLRKIATANLKQIEAAQPVLDDIINSVGGISRKKVDKQAQYDRLLHELAKLDGDLINKAAESLQTAHEKSAQQNSPTPLTNWKNDWLYKDASDKFVLTEPLKSEKMLELATIYEKYERELKNRAAYDYDDMILRAIDGLETSDELRFNIQERYQYLLLDEFQDTNPSQFKLVKTIANHPVHEGKPNVMAVGDDDQAIFAFQGATIGNMQDFLDSFSEVTVVNLTENYRSHKEILHVAHNIANQIEDRLHRKLDNIDKILTAANTTLPKSATIARHEFNSEASEYSWIADKIKQLTASGVTPSEITVLAPKHKLLEGMVPFLKQADVPLTYEKRENILETEIIQNLQLAAQLVDSLAENNIANVNQYMPLVLNQLYWNIPALEVWQVNWQLAKSAETRNWPEIAAHNKLLKPAVEFYLQLSTTANIEPLELTLDKLIGSIPVESQHGTLFSPLKKYYFDTENRDQNPLKYYEAISHLSVIRSKLRDIATNTSHQLTLNDFLNIFTLYEAAETPLLNTHPIAQSENSVQLMTAYKAKGLEFEHVFILQAHDDIWGAASRGNSNKLSLPANLTHIRYANSTEDERRRLFYVALTRAKAGLYITSHTNKDSGKKTTPLKFLSEADGISTHLPKSSQAITAIKVDAKKLATDTETLWQANKINIPTNLNNLLKDRLDAYRMSPTHLNTFIDVERAGPNSFLETTLLRFPQAPSASGEYGTAIHNTLEWYQNNIGTSKQASSDVLERFNKELDRRYMSKEDREHARAKGRASLQKYLAEREEMFKQPAKAEVNFYSEGVHIGDAHISGKIDRLEINEETKTINIVDYKTGKPLKKWANDLKSLKYRQQLYIYKFLLEGSSTWRGYSVESARLEFVEPEKNATGAIQPALYLDFVEKEAEELKSLITIVWNMIQALNLPNIDNYDTSYKGAKAFITDLLNEPEQ